MIIQKQWKIGVLLVVSTGISGCSGSSQPEHCQGISGTEIMENLYYIKDNAMKVKSAKMIRAVKQLCQQETKVKDNQVTNTSSDYDACFADKLVGCGFPDKAVKTLTESNRSDP